MNQNTIIVPNGFEPNYTIGFIKGLKDNNVNPVVISSDDDHDRLLENNIEARNFRGTQDSNRKYYKKMIGLVLYYCKLIGYLATRPRHILHFTGIFRNRFILFEGIFLHLFFRMISSRYIYTVHNLVPHNKENSLYFRMIYRFIYGIPNTLLVHTSKTKNDLCRFFNVPDEKIVVISIGLNEEVRNTELTSDEAREWFGYKERHKIILFFGKIDYYKGVDILLDAFNKLVNANTRLLIAGWFNDEAYREKILIKIKTSKRSGDICLHEAYIPNERVEYYFKAADTLILPYRHIYQSGVVFLSLYFGLPVVATDVGSMSEYIKENIGIIVKRNTCAGIIEGIDDFVNQERCFDRGFIINYASRYRWDRITAEIKGLYR